MPGPFPAETQARDRRADARDGSLDSMSVFQMVLQQLGSPNRRMITRLAGIAREGRLDQGVDDLGDRRRAARPRGVEQACPELEAVAPEEAVGPVVDGLPADLERLGDLLGGEPLGQPEHRLGATPLLGRRGPEYEVFQFSAQAGTQDDGSHRANPFDPWCLDDRFYLSKNFPSGPNP